MKARKRMQHKSRNLPIYCHKKRKLRIRNKTEIRHAHIEFRTVVAVYKTSRGIHYFYPAGIETTGGERLWNYEQNGIGNFVGELSLKRILFWFYDDYEEINVDRQALFELYSSWED